MLRDTWVIQLVKGLPLDFSSGLDLMVLESNPMLDSALTAWSLLGILSLSLSLSLSLPAHALSLSNKLLKKIMKKKKRKLI